MTKIKEQKRGEIILYKAKQGPEVEARLENETIWATLNQIVDLFGRDKSVISRHLSNIFKERELDKNSVVAKNATTARDGKTYQVEYYNLDAILSVGYRVNSKQATQFRIWATRVLREHITKGFTINEKRLLEAKEKFAQLQQTVAFLKEKSTKELLTSRSCCGRSYSFAVISLQACPRKGGEGNPESCS